jgi:hypothetical protein
MDTISYVLRTIWGSPTAEREEQEVMQEVRYDNKSVAVETPHILMQSDIVQNVVPFLNIKAMGYLASVCRGLNDICNNNHLWHIMATNRNICIDTRLPSIKEGIKNNQVIQISKFIKIMDFYGAEKFTNLLDKLMFKQINKLEVMDREHAQNSNSCKIFLNNEQTFNVGICYMLIPKELCLHFTHRGRKFNGHWKPCEIAFHKCCRAPLIGTEKEHTFFNANKWAIISRIEIDENNNFHIIRRDATPFHSLLDLENTFTVCHADKFVDALRPV